MSERSRESEVTREEGEVERGSGREREGGQTGGRVKRDGIKEAREGEMDEREVRERERQRQRELKGERERESERERERENVTMRETHTER